MLTALVPILLTIHVLLAVAMIAFILLQKNEAGGLGSLGGGGAGGMGGFLSGRAQANLLSRITRYLAIGFFLTSLLLAYADSHRSGGQPIVGAPAAETPAPAAPESSPAAPPAAPAAPVAPAAPSGQ